MSCLSLFYASIISFCYLAPLKPSSLFLATIAFAGSQQYTVGTAHHGDLTQDAVPVRLGLGLIQGLQENHLWKTGLPVLASV